MSFAFPIGVLALVSLPIVALLHLRRERNRKLVVSDTRPWDFLEEELHGATPRELPRTWLLLTDLAIAALLSFALSMPEISLPSSAPLARHLIVIVDSSGSMKATDVTPNRFEQAKLEAAGLLLDLGPRDIATVIRFGSGAEIVGDTRQNSLQELLGKVSGLQAGDTQSNLMEAVILGWSIASESYPVEFHILTDGAYSKPEPLDLPVNWHPFGDDGANQAVLEVSVESISEVKTQVFARVANFGDQPSSRFVSLIADGHVIDSGPMALSANSTNTRVWTVSGRPGQIQVELVGSDTLSVDDNGWKSLYPANLISVQLVAENPWPVDLALQSVSGLQLHIATPETWRPGRRFSLTVFRAWTPDVLPEGNVLIIEPDESYSSWGGSRTVLPGQGLSVANSPIFDGIDFSGVRWNRIIELSEMPEGFDSLAEIGGVPMIIGSSTGPRIVIILAELDSGNFIGHPAFPGLIAAVVEQARTPPFPDSVVPGTQISLPPPESIAKLTIVTPRGTSEYLDPYPSSWDDTLAPGLYKFELVDLDGRSQSHLVSVNAGDETESQIAPQEWLRELATVSMQEKDQDEARRSTAVAPWLLAASALLLLVEAKLAWR